MEARLLLPSRDQKLARGYVIPIVEQHPHDLGDIGEPANPMTGTPGIPISSKENSTKARSSSTNRAR